MDKEKMIAAGIDYIGALERFVGNVGLYEKYLARFLEDTHRQDAQVAYERGDFKETLEQIHALKGLAGTLGMVPLFEVTSEVVREIRFEANPVLKERMQKVESVYNAMIEAVRG